MGVWVEDRGWWTRWIVSSPFVLETSHCLGVPRVVTVSVCVYLQVYPVLLLCAVSTGLSVIIAVLTGTHVLQRLLTVSGCVYNRKSNICQCVTQFKRDKLDLERANVGEIVHLALYNVSSCEDVQTVIPTMLYTMVGIHGLLALVSAVAGIISFLVYRTERRRNYLEEEDYDEDDDSSQSTPSSNSDNYAEHHTMLPSHPVNSGASAPLGNIYTNTNATTNDEETVNDDGNTTPDLTYSPSEAPMGYAEACRMRRCQSFSQPRKGAARESSPASSASSQTASSLLSGERVTDGGAVRLKENRKKGRRAVTLHGLDREQLLLILSLQMRYLQESEQAVKKENKSTPNLNNINVQVNKTNNNPTISDTSQENTDVANNFAHLQRRAMTPTPRQERLSSSRATDDDLEYKTSKLVRSHTPQPYHFKAQPNNVQIVNTSALLPNIPAQYQLQHLQQQQFLQLQQYQQLQMQQLQMQQHTQTQLQIPQSHPLQQQILLQQPVLQPVEDTAGNSEPLTMITYDLRSVQTTGPLVYENVPSSRTSLSYYSPDGSCSSNSSSLLRSSNFSGPVGLSPPKQTRPLPAQPHSTDLSPVKVQGCNIQTTAPNSPNQISRQTSEVSTSSCTDSVTSELKQLSKSKEGTPENQQAKIKGKKKLSKKEKNAKKEEEKQTATDASTKPTSLGRTDSNSSKNGPVPDRWQALLQDGKPQAQTLWENVQRKIVSDPQTPDSTLTFPHTSHSASHTITQSHVPNYVPNPLPVVPNGILKNSKSSTYSQQSAIKTVPLDSQSTTSHTSQNREPPSPGYLSHNQVTNVSSYNAFIPIATSSTDNYEDIDNDFNKKSHHQSIQQSQENVPPPKPARLYARKVAHGGENVTVVDSQGQQLRPKSYISAIDRENMASGNLNKLSSQPEYGGPEKQSMTHLQMEGPVRDDRLTGPSVNTGSNDQFILINGDLYSQPRRKSIPSNLPTSNYGPHLYSNSAVEHNMVSSQHQTRGQYHYNTHNPQRSAFHTLAHGYHSDRSSHLTSNEICDTDLDDLPIPRWNSRYHRSQSFSPPPYAPPPIYQSMESVTKHTTIRPASSSSSDPHNSSSEGSTMENIQTGFTSNRLQHGATASMNRGRPLTNLTDRRFCLTQQRQLPQNFIDYGTQHQNNSNSAYSNFGNKRNDQDGPQVEFRRCQSVEEGNRKRLPPGNHFNNARMVAPNSFYPNSDIVRTAAVGHKTDSHLTVGPPVNRVRPIYSGSCSEQPAYLNGVQTFPKDTFVHSSACQTRSFPRDVSEEESNCSLDTDSVLSESSTQMVCQPKDRNGFIPAGRTVELSDSDKDEYAETVI
ncbi:hypothetical protein Btru_031007 [Bulinus truncatus]|nr:hypothetical protein Btru_031007 [Bulinus truncatus]